MGTSTIKTGRLVAYVRCNGTDAGAEQVRQGMAWVCGRYAPAASPLDAIEAEARAARRAFGLQNSECGRGSRATVSGACFSFSLRVRLPLA